MEARRTMAERDEQKLTEDEARVMRLRLEAMRDEAARRPIQQPPRDWTTERRAAGAVSKGLQLALFVGAILVGLYVLKLASKMIGL